MPLYGYARVSTTDQDLTLQVDALKAAGCDIAADGGAGLDAPEIARRPGIARGSIYRFMKEIQP